MSVKVIVEGLPTAKKYLTNKEKRVSKNTTSGLKKATIFLQGEVKQSIAGRRAEKKSVDTGRFLNSVGVSFGKYDGVVYTGLDYARGLEYGTSKLQARRHFNNSKNRNQGKIKELIQQDVNQI